jgi:UDP-N-acetyl-D-glucosamine dehydrogenase
MKNQLLSRINDKIAVIGIIGLGYVGLPLALRFIEAGYRVVGFDIDQAKINILKSGKSYIKHISPSLIFDAVKKNLLEVTTDFSKAAKVDALIICVPTPLNKYREPNLHFVINTVNSLLPFLHSGQVISLESTTYPGTTDEELLPLVESTGLAVGKEIFLVYSPEREDPGNQNFDIQNTPKVCSGITSCCLQVGVALYSQIVKRVIQVSSTRVAEMTKLLENVHRAVNIGLVNELKIVADAMGIDIWEVIDAAATKPFGFTPYYPGPGLGGHCIPIDPFYLTWKAREYGLNTHFIELAGEVNANMPDWIISKVVDALNERNLHLKGAKVLVLGIAYKKNIGDTRESPSVVLMEKLKKKGAVVVYSDPYVPVFPKMREHHFDLSSIDITPDNLSGYDCVIIATNHDDFDYKLIREHASLIVDTRGVYREPFDNIVKA